MKRFIIIAIIILAITPALGGYATPSPQGIPVGISDVKFVQRGSIVEDGIMGDFSIVDGHRPFNGAYAVTDSPDSNARVDFPQFGRFR